jgi:alkanesulfonate monooxygenase SsuD/methylene tetrahydromethanopterin reductase-like flavin-dependent oxidoreductase (luciferase family)
MWVGVKTPLHHVSWEAVRRAWRVADERAELSSAWVFDHVVPVWGDPAGSCLEAWTVLAALARETSRITVGTMCSPMALRHPFLLAQMACTVQHISAGRLSLGLGSGSKAWELGGLGLQAGSALRTQQLIEGLEVIELAFATTDRVSFVGTFYNCEMTTGSLATLAGWPPPPLIIGGRSDPILRVAAARAAHWNFPNGTMSQFRHARDRVVRYAADLGRSAPSCSAHVIWTGFSAPRLARDLRAWADAGVAGVIVALPAPWPEDAVSRLADIAECVG